MLARTPAKRFSLLLLEEGEDYVDDWVTHCKWPATIPANWQQLETVNGRLRLCSKSIFFEPEDIRIPIVRLPFVHTQRLEPQGSKTFVLASSLTVKMKANAADMPYVFDKRVAIWQFTLVYGQLSTFLPNAHQYLAASRLPYSEQRGALQALSQERMKAAVFDTSRLVDFGERVQYDGPAALLAPLIREAGRLVLTDRHLYFQALNNVSGDQPVRVHPLALVAAVARRRSSLKPTGLEVFFGEGAAEMGGSSWGSPSAFFAFASKKERERAAAAFMAEPCLGSGLAGGHIAAAAAASILEADSDWVQRVTAAWQRGHITNFDYLLFCNLAAGRSFNDLTQWPVFPWLIADYDSQDLDLDNPATFRDLSKPVGALNPSRLQHFLTRFQEMPREEGMSPPFMYGTHYSCPGYVMYWLVRAAPAHLLRLQTGRFDAPDRLFFSIKESWGSVLTGTTDVKELIPEFFLSDSSFLVNKHGLPLGTRQNGAVVGDVMLPPWALSPDHFLQTQRAALESPFVSANIHHWIDLIFGYKQQGPAAVEANNVFHPLTYEGAVEVAAVDDPIERQAMEAQINEFGQCPRQIFVRPHPPRLVCPPADKGSSTAASSSASALSLALVTMLRAAVVVDKEELAQPVPVEVSNLLRQLDLLRQDAKEAPAEPASTDQGGSASTSKVDRISPSLPSRMRSWSGRVSGQLTSIVDSLAPKGGETSRAILADGRTRAIEAVSGVSTSLRGLFQRQPTSGPSARGSSVSPASTSILAEEDRQPPEARALEEADAASDAALLRDLGLGSSPPQTDSVDSVQGPRCPSTSPDAVPPVTSEGLLGAAPAWGPGLRERLGTEARMLEGQHGSAAAVAAADVNGIVLYCVGSIGILKILSMESGTQIRAAKLTDAPLTSVALLPNGSTTPSHPLVLASSYDNKVYAYSVEYGRQMGWLEAHDDTVSCLQVVGRTDAPALLTASWDSYAKLWRLEEGRQPWGPNLAHPERELGHDAAVWALSASPDASLVVTGTEAGTLTAWDMRSPAPVFQAQPSDDYIGGVSLTPDSRHVVAVGGDGEVRLLEMRRAGAQLASLACESALHCCLCDGMTAVMGSDDGHVSFWDVAQQMGRSIVGGWAPPAPDGLYAPLFPPNASPINGLCMAWSGYDTSARRLHLLGAHDDGQISTYSTTR